MNAHGRITLVLALALAAAGCGDGGGEATAGKSDQQRFEQAALRHAACMRRHGVDVEDPQPGKGGIILRSGPGAGGSPALVARAEKACGKHLKNVPPPKLSAEKKEELRDAALAHARCMRRQGIDFPDPTFDENGGVSVRIRPGAAPDLPAVQRAEKACAKYAPGRIGGELRVRP